VSGSTTLLPFQPPAARTPARGAARARHRDRTRAPSYTRAVVSHVNRSVRGASVRREPAAEPAGQLIPIARVRCTRGSAHPTTPDGAQTEQPDGRVAVCQGSCMPDLAPMTHHGNTMASVFSLLGSNENDLTAALGWTLRSSPTLLTALTSSLNPAPQAATTTIDLEVSDDLGRTDLELHGADHVVVIEAERGWLLPTTTQLAAYASRCRTMPVAHLVTLSDCSPDWARLQLPATVDGVKVTHLSFIGFSPTMRA